MHVRPSVQNILPSLLVSVVLAEISFGQSLDLKFDHLSLEQGLSQSTVNAIVQDAQGFMWFATQDGLNRYDGYSITVFKHNAIDTNSLSDNSIWSLASDKRGDLWMGTLRGGLDRYVLSENRFVHYAHIANDTTSVSENNVISVFEDSYGSVWCGTLNSGLNRYDRGTNRFTRYAQAEANIGGLSNNTIWSLTEDRKRQLWIATWEGLCVAKLGESIINFKAYHHDPNDRKSLGGENIRVVYVDRDGTLWIGTWGMGLDRFDERTQTFQHFTHDRRNQQTISSNQILTIYEDSNRNLWIGTNDGGLNLFDRGTGSFTRYRNHPHYTSSLNNDQVSAIYEDASGVLWIGTGAGGVNMYDRRQSRFAHYRDEAGNPSDMHGNDVWAILEDRNGELWIGTYGSGLSRYDRSRNRMTNFRFDPRNSRSLSHDNVLSLCEDDDGTIWIGTEGGGLNRFERSSNSFVRFKHDATNENSISLDEVTALCADRNGNLWIGNNGGGVDVWNVKANTFVHYKANEKNPSALSGTTVMVIYEDRSGTIWIGTLGGGVHRFVRESNSFKRYRPSFEKGASVNNNTVLSIYEDNAGIIWMGTYGGGLNRFDPTTSSFTHFTEHDGLPNDVVYGILPDNASNLWLSTNKGISKFSSALRTFRNYDVKDGLQGNEFNQGSHFRSVRGELFFGGINGLNAFFPDSIKDNSFVPPVYLTSFKVFDKPAPLSSTITSAKHITLSHAENFFSFEFVALNYTSPEKNRFIYRLEGLDKEWISATAARRYASYTNLDPGDYVLRVKGSNNDDVWNEQGVSLAITITPPYWRTWWFRVLAAMCVGGILYAMYRYRVTKIVEIERIRSSIANDLHDDIGSTLTEIALYSDVSLRELRTKKVKHSMNGDIHKVESLLEDIGTTSRGLIDAMNDIVWAVDPKNDSFEFLLLRMKTHAARMFEAKGINYEIDIPEALSHLHLPLGFRRRFYLIFKEAVNNIMRHAHPTKVQLRIRKEGHSLAMTIVDDGKGFDMASANEGNGLSNMRKRAESLNGSLSVESAEGRGTTVKLQARIP